MLTDIRYSRDYQKLRKEFKSLGWHIIHESSQITDSNYQFHVTVIHRGDMNHNRICITHNPDGIASLYREHEIVTHDGASPTLKFIRKTLKFENTYPKKYYGDEFARAAARRKRLTDLLGPQACSDLLCLIMYEGEWVSCNMSGPAPLQF